MRDSAPFLYVCMYYLLFPALSFRPSYHLAYLSFFSIYISARVLYCVSPFPPFFVLLFGAPLLAPRKKVSRAWIYLPDPHGSRMFFVSFLTLFAAVDRLRKY